MISSAQIVDYKSRRSFIPKDFSIEDWDGLKPYLDLLLQEPPRSLEELHEYLFKLSELNSIVQEDAAWRYIKMTCNNQNKDAVDAYQYFVKEISPHLSIFQNKINQQLFSNPNFDDLEADKFLTYTRSIKNEIELFNKANIPLQTEARSVSQQYGAISGSMTITQQGETLTMQQASKLLESNDRALRKEVWEKMANRRQEDQEKLAGVFDQLVKLRDQIAKNTGFESYSSYKFKDLGRFDYTEADTKSFHKSVELVIKPLYVQLMQERKERLGVEKLRPWDLAVDIFGDQPLQPFADPSELVEGTIKALTRLHPEMGEMIQLMKDMGYLDLESRVGKSPGGYNYPLMEVGIPFIFMNAAGTHGDVVTMFHESGHAVHAFYTRDLALNAFKSMPSEVAELASMTMELLVLDAYDEFYPDEKSRIRAQKGQLLRCMIIFPWIATVDAFQQWVYDHPQHTKKERADKWVALYKRFHGDIVDWSGYEDYLEIMWLKQMHIFEVPFYYIEYAIAQLGALAIWRNFKENPSKGLKAYIEALKMGYTATIPNIYEQAGIKFDFSEAYIRECVEFCMYEYSSLKIPED